MAGIEFLLGAAAYCIAVAVQGMAGEKHYYANNAVNSHVPVHHHHYLAGYTRAAIEWYRQNKIAGVFGHNRVDSEHPAIYLFRPAAGYSRGYALKHHSVCHYGHNFFYPNK